MVLMVLEDINNRKKEIVNILILMLDIEFIELEDVC